MSHRNDKCTGNSCESRNRQNRYASRWDALPKSNSPIQNSSDTEYQSRQQLLRHNHRWNETDTNNINLGKKDDVRTQYRFLQAACYHSLQQNGTSKSPVFLLESPFYNLLDFMANHFKILPAEETATVVVYDILLPMLVLISTSEEWQQLPGNAAVTSLTISIANIIQTLLLSSPHASAMLSPITLISMEDVPVGDYSILDLNHVHQSNQDQSDNKNNPTRLKLWSVLQQCLPMTVECFTLCVQVTKRLDDNLTLPNRATTKLSTIHHASPHHVHLDLFHVIKYLREAFVTATEHLTDQVSESATLFKQLGYGLHLLLALLQYKPTNKVLTSSVSFIQSILFRNYATRNDSRQHRAVDCPFCGWHHTETQSSFLKILHGNPSQKALALQCASELLQSMPLSLWLGSGSKKSKKLSTFQQNVIDVLEEFIRIAICQVKQPLLLTSSHSEDRKSLPATETYIKAILTHIPFDDAEGFLQNTGSRGYDTLAVALVDAMLSQSLASIKNGYAPIIKECLRGHTTTTGPLSRTSPPLEIWLQQKGRAFLKQLLSRTVLSVPSPSELSLMYDILRSHPELIFTNPTTIDQEDASLSSWSHLERCVKHYTVSEPDMVAQCIEQLLLGRQMYMKELIKIQSVAYVSFDELLAVMLPIFESYITGQHVSDFVQGLACSGFSHLLIGDWNMIIEKSSKHGMPILKRMLMLIQRITENCTGTCVSEGLRVSCCKAIGNISTTLIPSSIEAENYEMAHRTTMKFFIALQQALSRNYSIATRCMAMFAIGNLSHTVVTTPKIFNLFHEDELDMFIKVADMCIWHMSDINEKLATNAVRTTAYMCILVLQCQDQHDSGVIAQKQLLFRRVTTTYVENIRSVIALESLVNPAGQPSWKRRMAIRKQGWGSCNSLSFLLERNVSANVHFTNGDDDGSDVVSCLLDCFENIHTIHEKIVLSACSAFRSIPDLSVMIVSDKLYGRAMVVCCTFLFGDESTKCTGSSQKKVYGEMELVLAKVLSHCRATGILEALREETFVSNLHQLFQWMLHQDCSPETFRLFATAFTLSGSVTDVNVEQLFINHIRSNDSNNQSELEDEL